MKEFDEDLFSDSFSYISIEEENTNENRIHHQ
jgi:hypothetical protein